MHQFLNSPDVNQPQHMVKVVDVDPYLFHCTYIMVRLKMSSLLVVTTSRRDRVISKQIISEVIRVWYKIPCLQNTKNTTTL
jgi:hypothetical protein